MNIALIDDNVRLSKNIQKFFDERWHTTDMYHSRWKFINDTNEKYDIYIIDISLQDGNGLDIAKYLRIEKKSRAPIIIISGYQGLKTKLEGFQIGVDDYIVKPFSPLELEARIFSIVHRIEESTTPSHNEIQYNAITLDQNTRKIFLHNEEVTFPKREKNIIEFFLKNQNSFMSRYALIEYLWLWDSEYEKVNNSLNVSIYKIRRKLWDNFQLKTINSEWFILES